MWRRVVNYVRHDLKEIVFPSSLPNPPGYVPPPPLTIREAVKRTQFALRSYLDTWNSEKLHAKLKERGQLDESDGNSGKAEVQDILADLSKCYSFLYAGERTWHLNPRYTMCTNISKWTSTDTEFLCNVFAAAAAKGGSKAMKPFLENLYQTRLVAYRDAAQNFIQGYKEGFQQGSKDELFDGNDRKTSDNNSTNRGSQDASHAAADSHEQQPVEPPAPPQ